MKFIHALRFCQVLSRHEEAPATSSAAIARGDIFLMLPETERRGLVIPERFIRTACPVDAGGCGAACWRLVDMPPEANRLCVSCGVRLSETREAAA